MGCCFLIMHPFNIYIEIFFRHMLTIIGNEEFYEQEKPLSLKDIKSLILILKQVHVF